MRILLLVPAYLENNAASVRLSQMVENFIKHDEIKHIKVVEFAWHLRSNRWKIDLTPSPKVSVTKYQGKFLPPILFTTMVFNPITFTLWFFIALREIVQGKRDMIIVSPPLFFVPVVATYLASFLTRRPFCLDIRDGWEESVDYAVELLPFYIGYLAKLLDRVTRKVTLHVCKKAMLISTPYEAIQEKLEHVCKTPIVIIRNGINFTELEEVKRDFNKEKVLLKYNLPCRTNSKFIIYSGSFREHYRPEILLPPLAQVITMGIDLIYIIIGGGKGEDTLKKLSNQMKVEDNVFFLGSKNHTEVLELLLTSDLAFYNLSKEYPHPECAMGVKAIEYIACELPILCVASSCASVYQLVRQYQLGICVESENPEDIVPALRNLIDHRDKYVRNIQAYYPLFSREFDRQRNLDKLYINILSQYKDKIVYVNT